MDPGYKDLDPGYKDLDPGYKDLDPGYKDLDPGYKALDPLEAKPISWARRSCSKTNKPLTSLY